RPSDTRAVAKLRRSWPRHVRTRRSAMAPSTARPKSRRPRDRRPESAARRSGAVMELAAARPARVDHEHPADVRADDLDVVRDARVPDEEIARSQLDDVLALAQSPAPLEHEVMLVRGVGMQSGPAAGRNDD